MKELKSNEPFEVTQGCPTVSFEIGGGWLMLCYSSFVSAKFNGDTIIMNFGDLHVEIAGKNLHGLWKHLQTQELRSIRHSNESDGADDHECYIEKILATEVAEKF